MISKKVFALIFRSHHHDTPRTPHTSRGDTRPVRSPLRTSPRDTLQGRAPGVSCTGPPGSSGAHSRNRPHSSRTVGEGARSARFGSPPEGAPGAACTGPPGTFYRKPRRRSARAGPRNSPRGTCPGVGPGRGACTSPRCTGVAPRRSPKRRGVGPRSCHRRTSRV